MPYRLELGRRLHGMVRQRRGKGALDLYLPVEYVHGVAMPASFIVSRGTLGGGELLGASQVMATMAAESPGAAPVTVDGVAVLQATADGGIHALQIGAHQGPDLLQRRCRAGSRGWRELQYRIQLSVSPRENAV